MNNKKKKRVRGGIALSLPVASGNGENSVGSTPGQSLPSPSATNKAANDFYWPTNGWRSATPESQGMDSAAIAETLEAFQDRNVQSLIIIRNGYVVAEAYNKHTQADIPQDMRSVTKSVNSALIGIAVSEQKINSVHRKLTDFFPEITKDPVQSTITIHHLLSMTSGLEWKDDQEESSSEMMYSDDWIEQIWKHPSIHQPGAAFNYSNGDAHLLSAVMQKATGETLFDYAKSRLFAPLGITDAKWNHDPQGYTIGAWALALTLRDMAKLGLLYLKQGVWDQTTVLPNEWIKESLTQRAYLNYRDGTRGGYGYYWWIKALNRGRFEGDTRRYDMFYASGSGGQRIFVVPELQLITAFTAKSSDVDMPEDLLRQIVLSVRSNRWIPESAEAAASLEQAIQSFKSV
ncbi:serine hydrolase domain-containing protein [Paenibacillus sp. SI8]|uniref:serine hydrolase domain-containing protein n=1 Tax=unclassified Paenibacillus TaxID=185978 RepID=UPI003467B865